MILLINRNKPAILAQLVFHFSAEHAQLVEEGEGDRIVDVRPAWADQLDLLENVKIFKIGKNPNLPSSSTMLSRTTQRMHFQSWTATSSAHHRPNLALLRAFCCARLGGVRPALPPVPPGQWPRSGGEWVFLECARAVEVRQRGGRVGGSSRSIGRSAKINN